MSKISATAFGQRMCKTCKTCGRPIINSINGECMECHKLKLRRKEK